MIERKEEKNIEDKQIKQKSNFILEKVKKIETSSKTTISSDCQNDINDNTCDIEINNTNQASNDSNNKRDDN